MARKRSIDSRKLFNRRTIYTGTALHSTKANPKMFSKKTSIGRTRRKQLADAYKSARKNKIWMRRGATLDSTGRDYFAMKAKLSGRS